MAELWAWERLCTKALAEDGDPNADVDVIKEIIETYQEGNLPREGKNFYDLTDEENARLQTGEKTYVEDDPFPYGRPSIRLIKDAEDAEIIGD
jgi:hypothetical protein